MRNLRCFLSKRAGRREFINGGRGGGGGGVAWR